MRPLLLLLAASIALAAWGAARAPRQKRPHAEPAVAPTATERREAPRRAAGSKQARSRVRRRVEPPPARTTQAATAYVEPIRRLPLVVDVVDAVTGRLVPLPDVAVWLDDGEPSVETSKSGTTRYPEMVEVGEGRAATHISVDPCDGDGGPILFPDPLRSERIEGPLSRFATSFRVIEPMRREARVAVRVLSPTGSLATAESIQSTRYLGKSLTTYVDEESVSGGLVLRSFAHLPGEQLLVHAEEHGCAASGRVTLGADAEDVPLLELRLVPMTRRGGRRNLRSSGSG